MEANDLKNTQKSLYIFLLTPVMGSVMIYIMIHFLEVSPVPRQSDEDVFIYTLESLSILISLVSFWLALRMLSNRSMAKWLVKNSSSYLSIALLRGGLLNLIILLGLMTHYIMGCPTTHWLCVLGLLGLLFVWPTKGRILDESELYDQIKNNNEIQ